MQGSSAAAEPGRRPLSRPTRKIERQTGARPRQTIDAPGRGRRHPGVAHGLAAKGDVGDGRVEVGEVDESDPLAIGPNDRDAALDHGADAQIALRLDGHAAVISLAGLAAKEAAPPRAQKGTATPPGAPPPA